MLFLRAASLKDGVSLVSAASRSLGRISRFQPSEESTDAHWSFALRVVVSSPPLPPLPCLTLRDVPGWLSFIQPPRTRACQNLSWSPVRALCGQYPPKPPSASPPPPSLRGRDNNTEEFPVLRIRNQLPRNAHVLLALK